MRKIWGIFTQKAAFWRSLSHTFPYEERQNERAAVPRKGTITAFGISY
jgi:hypothetical protein